MAQKFESNIKLSPQELAKHLKQPQGEEGKQVGLQMNKGNKHICLNTYEVLKPQHNDKILEIGMGNGFFIKDLLSKGKEISYTGADFSPTMIEEASKLNEKLIASGQVHFIESSIEKLPIRDNQFDKICSTNTIYFWPEPLQSAKELFRVLKTGGRLVIAYRGKEFMDKVELANYGFKKYTTDNTEALLMEAGFSKIETTEIKEPNLEFEGKEMKMTGFYTIAQK